MVEDVEPGQMVALVIDRAGAAALAIGTGSRWIAAPDAPGLVRAMEADRRPRWVLWDTAPAQVLAAGGVRLATAWHLAAVHRLIAGGHAADPARVWASAHGLPESSIPSGAPPNLFTAHDADDGEPDQPVRPDGHLRPDWCAGAWRDDPGRLRRWAELALQVARRQTEVIGSGPDPRTALTTARSESAAELLCADMAVDGLPVDRAAAEAIIAASVGPRPGPGATADGAAAARDAAVLAHLPAGVTLDLRSTAQVRAVLGHLGIDVADTRAWRLREVADRHPFVAALLAWRKAERMATTYGYAWLDRHLAADGRLRGEWSAADGAAGRMTASAGLHNMPAELRPAVRAEAGHLFVRADLGQVEPRVLAAVAGDAALAAASTADDLYRPIATELGVDRETAKVAVLGAMYGQTTGHGASALRRLSSSYPVAVGYLERAARDAEAGRDLRTQGGRRVRMGGPGRDETPAARAARGRYGRNAVIQGAAAELFKTWAVTVRARTPEPVGRIVLCLHDELLLHVEADRAEEAAGLVERALGEAVHRWIPATPVRFVADISVVERWSDAKAPAAPATG